MIQKKCRFCGEMFEIKDRTRSAAKSCDKPDCILARAEHYKEKRRKTRALYYRRWGNPSVEYKKQKPGHDRVCIEPGCTNKAWPNYFRCPECQALAYDPMDNFAGQVSL